MLTGEQLPWTPALHQLFPRAFKQAVCTLLLYARAGHSESLDKRNAHNDQLLPAVDVSEQVSSTSAGGGDASSSSHYSDAESAAVGEFSTPGSIKEERPVEEEEEAPMFTPFDVRLRAHLGEESSQDEAPSPGLSAVSEVTSTGGARVSLPLPVVMNIASHMAYPITAWLASPS